MLSREYNEKLGAACTDKQHECYQLWCEGKSHKEIGEILGKSKASVCTSFSHIRKKVSKLATSETSSTKEKQSITFQDNKGSLDFVGPTVQTLDQALAAANVDQTIWEVDSYTINKWDVAMREPATTVGGGGKDALVVESEGGKKSTLWTRGSNKPLMVTNWQVKVKLRRKITKSQEQHFSDVLDRMKKHSPVYKKMKYKKVTDPHLFEIALFDAHFGKLAWSKETLENYDLEIASQLYRNACEDLLNLAQAYNVERIVFPIGHDLFHMDDATNETPRGHNRLDVEGRLGKVSDVAQAAVTNAIDLCMQVAPVDVVFVPGNHDPNLGRQFAKTIQAWYRLSNDVTVDPGDLSRKYYRYGTLLLGMTHRARFKGGGLSPERLSNIMAVEAKQDWAETTWHEWHLGDQHRKLGASFMDQLEELGTRVRWLPSLNAQDKWHFDEGFVLQRRCAESYLWSKTEGYRGHFSVNARGPGGLALENIKAKTDI
jgi:hypothetical protein